MAKVPGVTPRPAGRTSGLMQAHVELDVRDKARAMATAAGVSMAAYLEALIRREQVDEQGRPVWWRELRNDTPKTDEELPLRDAS